jgi:hypothetical protein
MRADIRQDSGDQFDHRLMQFRLDLLPEVSNNILLIPVFSVLTHPVRYLSLFLSNIRIKRRRSLVSKREIGSLCIPFEGKGKEVVPYVTELSRLDL